MRRQWHRLADHRALCRYSRSGPGRVACGSYNNGPDLVWSKNSALLLADAHGPNMDDLHKWWLKFG
jgi:hypothetical protein